MRHFILLLFFSSLGFHYSVQASDEADQQESFFYEGPLKASSDLQHYFFYTFDVASVAYVAEETSNVFSEPSIQSQSLAKLPFGKEVKILKRLPKNERNYDYVNQWYHVEFTSKNGSKTKQGYIFGSALTDQFFRQDFNNDGHEELLAVTFTPSFKIKVSFKSKKSKLNILELKSYGEAYVSGKGSRVKTTLLPKTTAGMHLLQIYSGQEACADYGNYWIQLDDKPMNVVLELSGLVDPPVISTYEVTFFPQKTAEVIRTSLDFDENGNEIEINTKQIYHFVAGKYEQRPQPNTSPQDDETFIEKKNQTNRPKGSPLFVKNVLKH